MISVSCGYCGSEKHKKVFDSPNFSYVQCNRCGLVYQNPQPDFEHLKSKVYINKYFKYELRNENNFVHLMELNLKDSGFLSLTEDWKGKKRFLDIGSATGLLLSRMKKRGWVVEGIELTKDSAQFARKKYGVKVHNKVLEAVKFQEGAFDAIHMSHVIEHVPHPTQTLREIYRVLKKNGLFLIITPNYGSFQAMWFREKWRSAHKDHLTLFSKRTLSSLLKKNGFKILCQYSYGGLAKGIPPVFLKPAMDRLARILNVGDVMVFLCRK